MLYVDSYLNKTEKIKNFFIVLFFPFVLDTYPSQQKTLVFYLGWETRNLLLNYNWFKLEKQKRVKKF